MSSLSRLEGAEGAEGAEGWNRFAYFPGYRSGGASPSQTLLPGVDPDTALGLLRSREALHRNAQSIARIPQPTLPKLGDADRLEQWSIEIRAENLMAELIGPLRRTGDAKEESYTLSHGKDVVFKVIRPNNKVFQSQVQLVVDATPLRSERLQEIITQIGIPIQYWATIVDLSPTTTPYTLELIALAMAFGSAVHQPCKHTLGCPRPASYSPSVQPVINPRRFGAFPSGHCMEAFLTARLLQILLRQPPPLWPGEPTKESGLERQFQRLAMRIADHRVIAGVHFPIDSTAGRMVGETLATYLAHRCDPKHNKFWVERTFDGKFANEWDKAFYRHDRLDGPKGGDHFFHLNNGVQHTSAPSPVVAGGESLLAWLWKEAQAEWPAP